MKTNADCFNKPVETFVGAILIISALVASVWFLQFRMESYRLSLDALSGSSWDEVFEANDSYSDVKAVAEKFDTTKNRVWLCSPDPSNDQTEWAIFELRYLFYPGMPELMTYDLFEDMNSAFESITSSGDVVVSLGDIGLDPVNYEISAKGDHVTYVKQ